MRGDDKVISLGGNNQSGNVDGASAGPRFDDVRRLAALRRYEIVDSPAEIAFDDLAALAAQICATPIALVSLVDENRLWFKSRVGFDPVEIPRQHAFCADAILNPLSITQVRDATLDNRFSTSAYVVGELHMRFYAGAPLVTPEGHALGTICVMDKVARALSNTQCEALEALSRQVMAQLELRRSISGLRSTIGELARAQRDLSHVRTSVTRAKQSSSRFLANIVGEIRGPLHTVVSAAQELHANESVALDAKNSAANQGARAGSIKQILAGGMALEEVVTQLSRLAEIDRRGVSVNNTQQPLRPFLNDIISTDSMSQSAIEASISIVCSVANNAPGAIFTDWIKLAQILTALLENAIKFAKPQTVVNVDVAYFAGMSNRAITADTLRISVRDDGDIIAQNQLDAVFFDLANSVERTAARSSERVLQTGLNMSVAKRLANVMDSDIAVQSTVEMGTQFVLSLPLAIVPNRGPAATTSDGLAHAASSPTAICIADAVPLDKLAHEKSASDCREGAVLVAEDDQISGRLIVAMLRKRGLEARLVENGAQAVAEALKSRPDLLLMDFHMPQMNGIEAMREIRAQPGFKNLPIVIMSADTQAMEVQALVVGASAVITKPIDLSKLEPILRRFLRTSAAVEK